MIKVPKTGTRDKETQESLFLRNAQNGFMVVRVQV